MRGTSPKALPGLSAVGPVGLVGLGHSPSVGLECLLSLDGTFFQGKEA